jgi:hypothetical protein
MFGHGTVGRKQRQTNLLLAYVIKNFDALEPTFLLAVVDFTQIKHVPLHDTTPAAPTAFNDGPVTMFFAIFDSAVTFQMHIRRAL